MGVELEAGELLFRSQGCDRPSTVALKGNLVNSRQGTNWDLTADTTPDDEGFLTAEYILDGTKIKIGSNMAVPAALAVTQDLVRVRISSTR
jgi:hypothetical protein